MKAGQGVPWKVSILAQRLLHDRLPTKVNLVTRGILSWKAHYCVSGCGAVESAQHLVPLLQHFCFSLVTFVALSAGGLRARRSFMQLIWLVSVWVVWHERNSRLFRGSANSVQHMLDKIKAFSYRLMKATSSTLALNYHCWWSCLLLCLSLV
ncbi:hypothetical protein TSUD_137800 [Trifolium subterraneum]|uniref:Reverse transcriptase zinc-binding domain-containing protein n=1 Tax=Trifolium subterraneum TaxID=3900 RepID=A0A2Z6PGY1_TRISU|nr:hypothetical protein TSUD_137800 [Trifolium subterraneum]